MVLVLGFVPRQLLLKETKKTENKKFPLKTERFERPMRKNLLLSLVVLSVSFNKAVICALPFVCHFYFSIPPTKLVLHFVLVLFVF